MVYEVERKNIFAAILLISSLIIAFVGSASAAEVSILITVDAFDDYVVKPYPGSDGPGMWFQDIGGGGSAIYQIVSSGGRTFYKLESSDGVFVKAILPYFLLWAYFGPVDYTFSTTMKVDNGEGGIIFRVQPVQIGSTYYLRKYYLATVYKNTKKLVLWYVDEREGAGAGPKLAEVNIPTSIDLNNWFALSVTVRGNNIKVSMGGQDLIDVNDNRLSYGTVGLYTFKGCTASFDSINWIGYISQTTATTTATITKTTTTTASAGTLTETLTETYVVTTILTETGEVVTTTVTKTPPTETVTEMVSTTMTETQTKSEVSTATLTETVTKVETTTATKAGGLGCLIATAAFGSEIAPQVQSLRDFRDGFVMNTFAGENFMKAFNAFYYSWSPYVARAEYDNPLLKDVVKTAIYPLLFSLEISKNAATQFSMIPELAILISGLFAAFLIGLIYFAPLATSIYLFLRWRGRDLNVNLLYPATSLAIGLLSFILAEASASSLFMMISSSIVVLSTITIGMIAPIKALSIQGIRKKL